MIKMSEEIKQKAKSWADIIYKTFVGVILVMIFKSIPIGAYNIVEYLDDMEDRTLSSVEMRIDLERHMAVWTETTPKEAFGRLRAVEEAAAKNLKADSINLVEHQKLNALLKEVLAELQQINHK